MMLTVLCGASVIAATALHLCYRELSKLNNSFKEMCRLEREVFEAWHATLHRMNAAAKVPKGAA